MQLKLYKFTETELQTMANEIKDMLLQRLEKAKLLKESMDYIGAKYVFVLHEKGWLGRIFEKYFNRENNEGLAFTIFETPEDEEKSK